MEIALWILGLCAAGAGGRREDAGAGMDWLTRYGYLPPPDPYSAQQQTMDGLIEAVKSMQKFAGLRQTGILDEDTIAMMHKPRCSLPDIMPSGYQRQRRKRYAPSGAVWQKRHLTWRIESFPISVSQETTKLLIASALTAWSRESNLQFSETRAVDADLRVSFLGGSHGDGYPFDGPGGTLGHAFFPGVGPSAGATHMDADESWTYNVDEGTDLFAVAVHEFGHSLGLSHSSAEHSIMRPYYQGTLGDHQYYRLPWDDVEGIQALYGKRNVQPGAEPPPPPVPTRHFIPPQGPTYRPHLPFPDRCSTHFDAVANIRGEVFFFKGRYFWRVQATRQLVSLKPAHLGRFWLGLPPDLTRVDAVYERGNDSKIVFIAGTNYWVFKDTSVEPGYPRPLTDFGLNSNGVDGVFVWKHNKKTYFFRHNRYWRFDEHYRKMDPGYPRDSNLWLGLPNDVDDVISWTDGHTYFFKGAEYWKFQDGNVEAEPGYPRSIAMNWMYCAAAAPPEPTQEPGRRDQRDCNCPCSGKDSALLPAAFRLIVALMPTLLLGAL
ncbi:matrix metalloproteinase-25 [Phyllobates terribilis]|uniref:matrix metalloproteinase-25 n=1 Tax=Phyllobates terribilis TaxID=111132 RepID=UPI003CCAA6D2